MASQGGPSGAALLSTPLHGVLIPSILLIVGVSIVDRRYALHAVAGAAALAFWKFFRGRSRGVISSSFAEFELIERTELGLFGVLLKFALPLDNHVLGAPLGNALELSIENEATTTKSNRSQGERLHIPITSNLDSGFFEVIVAPNDPVASLQEHQVVWARLSDTIPAFVYQPSKGSQLNLILCANRGSAVPLVLQLINSIVRSPSDLTNVNIIALTDRSDRLDLLVPDDLDVINEKYPRLTLHYISSVPLDDNVAKSSWSKGPTTAALLKDHLKLSSVSTNVVVGYDEAAILALHQLGVDANLVSAVNTALQPPKR